MKRIVFTRPDGGISVVEPQIHLGDPEDFTEDQAIERSMRLLPQDAIDPHVIEEADVPQDRTYRNAWTKAEGQDFSVDMEKAREIQREALRKERDPILASLDVDFMKAVEQGDQKAIADIATRKQALRDVTDDAALEQAQTPEDLKALTLDVLAPVELAADQVKKSP